MPLDILQYTRQAPPVQNGNQDAPWKTQLWGVSLLYFTHECPWIYLHICEECRIHIQKWISIVYSRAQKCLLNVYTFWHHIQSLFTYCPSQKGTPDRHWLLWVKISHSAHLWLSLNLPTSSGRHLPQRVSPTWEHGVSKSPMRKHFPLKDQNFSPQMQ